MRPAGHAGGPLFFCYSASMQWMRSRLFLFLLLSFGSALHAHAAKTDVVVLKNGDRITGEVKTLEQGRLKYSTDNAGTIYIEWEDIASLTASRIFEVETIDGDIFHGSIEPGAEVATLKLVEG